MRLLAVPLLIASLVACGPDLDEEDPVETDCNPATPRTCVGDQVHVCNADGTIGGTVATCPPGQCAGGSCSLAGNCDATGVESVYVVDSDSNLLRFDPSSGNSFEPIGRLACAAGTPWEGPGPAHPFSMSVDRSGTAWVLYDSGEIFWVSTENAACVKSPYGRGQSGYELFGMGFSTDAEGAETEKLFIAGGRYTNVKVGNFGYIEPTGLTTSTIGPIPTAEYAPELTGTGEGKLFAYFPGTTTTYVTEVNRQTGGGGARWDLPPLEGTVTVSAWAFAHWGGKFYVFVSTLDFITEEETSMVYRLDPATGDTVLVMPDIPYRIVGAGVSTCAPVVVE